MIFMEQNKRKIRIRLLILSAVLLATAAAGVLFGAVKTEVRDVLALLAGEECGAQGRILLYVRLPRVAGALVAGAGLALSGTIIQMILDNPLAGPNIIGVNAGAGFAVVSASALFPRAYAWYPAAAFGGAFLTVLFVYLFGRRTGSSKITLVLSGVAINSILNSASDVVHTISEESLVAGSAFKIGGLAGISMPVLKAAAIAVFAAALVTFLFRNELEIFAQGEEMAKALGLPVAFYRFLFLALAAVLSGAAVSFAGLIGFVGLIVPHMARLFVGGECRYLLPASAMAGAAFLTFCDLAGRTLFAPYEIPAGIILSFLGAPFFLWLLIRRKRNS